MDSCVIFPKPLENKRKHDTVFGASNIDDIKMKGQALSEHCKELSSENETLKGRVRENELKLKAKAIRSESKNVLKLRIKRLMSEKKVIHKSSNVLRQRLKSKNSELMRLRSRLVYSEKCVNKKIEAMDSLKQQMEERRVEYETLLEENNGLKKSFEAERQENDWLRDCIQTNEAGKLSLFDKDKGTYTPRLQKCVYQLLEHHVSATQMSDVIQSVLSLAGKQADRLPSASTVLNMNIQRLAIAQKQLAEIGREKKHTSLYTDETSKFGTKVGGYHIRDSDGSFYTLGMRELTTKSGKDTLQVLKEILTDIDEVANDTDNQTSKEILTNISSTMSDSASTEVKFNELLEDFRSTVLPFTVENYDNLDDAGRASLNKLLNFFCGLHSLIHFAETSNVSMLKVEKELFEGESPIEDKSMIKPSEAGTSRLIRTACKAFARGADEKSGCHIQFVTYVQDFLKEKKQRTLKLVPYRGNRFNILFHNAAQVYMLHRHMTTFLEGYSLNRLTKSVLHDLKQPVYIAGCKALGLMCVLVCTPFWNILEDKSISMMDMNVHYLNFITALKDAIENVDEFMAGKIRPFPTQVKENEVFKVLVEASEFDDNCMAMLNVILPAVCRYIQRKFEDFLPGGKYAETSPELKQKTASVEKHNKHCERVFAYYDQLLRFKPNISTLATESYVMFTLNKTAQWLEGKSEDQTRQIVEEARGRVKEIRKKFRRRSESIRKKQMEKINEQRRANELTAARKLKEQEKYTNDIVYHGLWQSESQIDEHLASYNTIPRKIEALKCQLRFRKNILKQKYEDSSVFNFSKDKVSFKVEELTSNLKTLVQHSYLLEDKVEKTAETQLLNKKRVRHKFLVDGAETWCNGKVISQV